MSDYCSLEQFCNSETLEFKYSHRSRHNINCDKCNTLLKPSFNEKLDSRIYYCKCQCASNLYYKCSCGNTFYKNFECIISDLQPKQK